MGLDEALVVRPGTTGSVDSLVSDLDELDLLGSEEDASSRPESSQEPREASRALLTDRPPTTEISLRFQSMKASDMPETEMGARFLNAKQDPYLKIILGATGLSAQTNYIDGAGKSCEWPDEELTFHIPRALAEEVDKMDAQLAKLRHDRDIATAAGQTSEALELKKEIDHVYVQRQKR